MLGENLQSTDHTVTDFSGELLITYPSSRCEGAVDIEEADCVLDRAVLEGRVDTCSFRHDGF